MCSTHAALVDTLLGLSMEKKKKKTGNYAEPSKDLDFLSSLWTAGRLIRGEKKWEFCHRVFLPDLRADMQKHVAWILNVEIVSNSCNETG